MVILDTLSQDARQAFLDLQAEIARLNRVIALKDEWIRLANLRLYGPKHEKLSADQKELLPLEISLQEAEVEQEAERPEAQKQNLLPRAKKQSKTHAGRDPLPAHLERREELIPCCAEDCRCEQCGAERPVIGYEVREELACEPAKYWVRVIKREKRGSHCLDEQGVATAVVPMQIVPKSKLSNELVIEVLVQKYQQHQPIYRQCAVLAQEHGIELNAKTLGNAVLGAGELLEAVVRAQALELKAGGYLQADETTVQVQTPERTGKNHRAYMWQYSQPSGPVVFDFQMRRSRAGPREFLSGFRGKLQSDGYAAYADVGEGIVHVGCMAHARRGFVEANKLAPQDPLPVEVVQRIGKLYAVESEARAAGMSAEQRRQLRQQKSVPVMAALKTRLVEIRQGLSPGGKMARACDYMLGQWSRLEQYLGDGSLEIDNNWCEGAMRPLALGRKNWLHIGSEATGPKVAAIASIVETCRRLKINLRQYLSDVLPRLGEWPMSRVGELTPAAWKAAQKI